MLEILIGASWVTLILFIWFESTAFFEYCKLFGIYRPLKGYNKHRKIGITYPQHLFLLKIKNPLLSFIIKLISCPVCLTLWLSFIAAFFAHTFAYTALIYITSLILYWTLGRLRF